jgi:hypothetical protein
VLEDFILMLFLSRFSGIYLYLGLVLIQFVYVCYIYRYVEMFLL